MNARQAVEEALDTVQKSLAALSGAALRAAFDPKLAEGIRDVENRRRRLVTLPEMPMRTTEAQEIQQSLATIEHDLRPAPADLQDEVRAALQPLRHVLQRYAEFVGGQLRFPEEHDLMRASLRPPTTSTRAGVPSLVERARHVIAFVFGRR
jgi:phosphoglycerate-specific signal transduction histidine kinase